MIHGKEDSNKVPIELVNLVEIDYRTGMDEWTTVVPERHVEVGRTFVPSNENDKKYPISHKSQRFTITKIHISDVKT
jgi:hypothetical protein